MRFQDIVLAPSALASADPRANPDLVPDTQIIQVDRTLSESDTPAPYMALVLEGTAADTLDVTVWAQANDQATPFSDQPALNLRRFYKVAATVTLTVGTMKTVPAVRGKIYLQTSAVPAHATTLRVSAMMAAIP
jgi:hypothetical protein